MIEEFNLFGVYVPAALVWAILATAPTLILRDALHRWPFYRTLWRPALVELAIYALCWLGLTLLADRFLPHWLMT